MSEVQTAITGADPKPMQSDELSGSDFIARRLKASKPKENVPSQEQKPEAHDAGNDDSSASSTPEGETGTDETNAPSKDVLSKAKSGNLDELTGEELDQLAKALGSKAVARFGELTAKRKQAEAEAQQLRAELARRANTPVEEVENNPYAALETLPEITAKAKEINGLIEMSEAILDQSEGAGPDEIVHTEGERSFTRKEIKASLRAFRQARDKFIPAQAAQVAKRKEYEALETGMMERARQELGWLNEDSELKKRYEEQMADPEIKALRKTNPRIAALMPLYVAHATQSMFARKEIKIDEPKPAVPAKPKPPSTPQSTAAAPERRDIQTKQAKETANRFRETGSAADFVALRTIAHSSKRQTIK